MSEPTPPDPQVVAWMRGYLEDHRSADYIDATNAYFIAHPYDMTKDPPGMRASYDAARRPLTLADIPAGQGAASLFIAPDSTGVPRVYYKDADGDITAWSYSADSRHGAARAMWEHLAATLPIVEATP